MILINLSWQNISLVFFFVLFFYSTERSREHPRLVELCLRAARARHHRQLTHARPLYKLILFILHFKKFN